MVRKRNSRKVNVHNNYITDEVVNLYISGIISDSSHIEVRFPLPYGHVDKYDFTRFINTLLLAEQFAFAFYAWGAAQKQVTRKRKYYFLVRFFEFLDELYLDQGISVTSALDIDLSILKKYIKWLRIPKPVTRGSSKGTKIVWGAKSRRAHLTIVTNLIEYLLRESPDAVSLGYVKPKVPIRGIKKQNTPTKSLTITEIAEIERACIDNIQRITKNHIAGKQLVSEVMDGFDGSIDDLLNYENWAKHKTISMFNAYVDALERLKKGEPTSPELLDRKKRGLLQITMRSVSTEARQSKTALNSSLDYEKIRQAIFLKKYDVQKIKQCKDIDIAHILAYVTIKYNGVLPLQSADKDLEKAMSHVLHHYGKESGESEFFSKFLTPSPVDLVPFIVILTSRGFWNAESILKAPRDGMWKAHSLRNDRIVVNLHKGRSNKFIKRTFAKGGDVPIDEYLVQVKAMTEQIVKNVDKEHQHRLFLFRTKFANISTFHHSSTGCATSDTWYRSLRSFIKDNNLPSFTLGNLRITGSDRAHRVTNGDIKASQKVLGHQNTKITMNHYTSDAMKTRNSITIAKHQQGLIKWAHTNKMPNKEIFDKVDIKGLSNAVTEGFSCKNPYQSPFMEEGSLCNAWLGCLQCQNAIVIKDANTLARILQLKTQLEEGRNQINEIRFNSIYEPKLLIIVRSILPQFTNINILVEAKQILLTLPNLPEIE